jgi:LacI family transcriptional regulator
VNTPSVRDVAAHAGVSVGTVSNVLNHPGKVQPETVVKVQESILALGFIRNDAARQLRIGHSETIGFILLQAGNPFFSDVARGAEEAVRGQGLSVLLANSDQDPEREDAYLALFEQQRVHGVLISPAGDVSGRLENMRGRGIASVLVDRNGAGIGVSSVSVDDVAGGRMAAGHLLELGRRRIAVLAAHLEMHQVHDRLAGARQAVANVPDATLEVIDVGELDVLAGRDASAELVQRPSGRRPDGVFAVNDLIALGLLQSLVMSEAVRVPEDVAVIGYDDIAFAVGSIVPLSSIRQPSRLIGRRAIELLLEHAADPALPHRQVVFQPELVVRASTQGEQGLPPLGSNSLPPRSLRLPTEIQRVGPN